MWENYGDSVAAAVAVADRIRNFSGDRLQELALLWAGRACCVDLPTALELHALDTAAQELRRIGRIENVADVGRVVDLLRPLREQIGDPFAEVPSGDGPDEEQMRRMMILLALEPAMRLVSCIRSTTSREELEEIMTRCFFIARAAKVDDDGRRMLEDVGGVAG